MLVNLSTKYQLTFCMKFISEKKISLFYFLSVFILISVLVVLYLNNQKVKSTTYLVEHTREVLNLNNNVMLDILNIETSSRGYFLTGNSSFLEPFNKSITTLDSNIAALALLTIYNPIQQQRIILLKNAATERVSSTRQIIKEVQNKALSPAFIIDIIEKGKIQPDEIRSVIDDINQDEFDLLKQRKKDNENDNSNTQSWFVLLLFFITVIFILVFLIIKNQMHGNKEMAASTSALKLLSKYSLSLIEASLDPLVTISITGKITDMNEALVNITGIEREKLKGSDFFDYFTEPQKARQVYQEVFEKESVADFPLILRHKDGKLTDVLFNGSVYKDDSGKVLGVVIVARDVTAQTLLSKYSLSLIEASLDPLVTINTAGKITDMNDALVNITGIEREKLKGSDFFDYFTEPQKAREVYQEVFAIGSVADSPLTLRHKDGKLTDVLFNGSVYKDDRGNVLGVVIVARDVTAQTLLSKYSLSLIEASLDPLVTINVDGKITDVNEASVKVTGETRDKLIGADFSDYFTEPEEAREGYKQVFEKGFVSDYPLTIRHKNGNLTDVLYNASVYKDDKGNVLGVVATARDITAQKQASQYARSLIEASLDPLVTISPEGKIMDVNEASAKVTGETRDKLIGADFCDYFTEPEKAREGYKQVFEKGFVSDYPLTIRHKNGNLTDVLYNASVYKDDKGNVLGVFAAARDVTAQTLLSKYSLSLIEASLDPLVTISTAGKITDMNEALVNITGNEREKLKGSDFFDYFTEPQKAREVYQEVFAIGSVADSPLTLRHKNGKLTDVLFNGSVYKDDRGNVLGIVIVARDVTAQTLLSKYSLSLIEASLDPLVTISNAGKITDMNEALVNITGIERGKLKGSDFFDYFTEPQKAREVYQEVFAIGSVADSPLTLRHKNGKLTDVLFNGSVYKDDRGNVLGVVIVARDVTAQKLASQYARSLIEASLDPLFTISTNGKITDMNHASVKVTGVAREQLNGTDFFDYFTEPARAREGYQQVFAKGFVADYPLTIKDGNLTDVLFNGSVYKDEQGNVLGVVVVARDITYQKRIEKDLTEAIKFAEFATIVAEEAKTKAETATLVAENAVKSKQQFLSNMSHEIRTPMNAIIGFTKVVLKTDLTAKQHEYLTAIKLSGDALIVLINDILDLAKVDAGKMTFEQIPFKMEMSISAMLHLFETKIQERNLELITVYDSKIPEVLLGDPVRLHQIILNLVSNAVKFTTRGNITVSVHLLSEDEENAVIEFAITDTGIGIAENKMGNVFENFQQATSGTSRLYGGTGLGLAIVKQLVEPQGGSVHVLSKINEGSTFSFILPFKKTLEAAMVDANIIQLDTAVKNLKVLVVEDMALNQLLMKTLLDDFGFEKDIVSNGKLAIEILQSKSYDIILMDLQMPEMNGFEATDYIRNKMNSDVPIIALTADVTTVDLEKCKAVGMNDYVSKPVDERILYSKMVGLVKKSIKMKNIKIKERTTDTLIPKMKCINLGYLSRRTKSNPVLMMEMIALYLEQTPPLVSKMTQSFNDKDWLLLSATLHKMIPSFSIMGISADFENMAKTVREFAGTQQQNEKIPELVLQLETVCKQACIELEQEMITIKNTKL